MEKIFPGYMKDNKISDETTGIVYENGAFHPISFQLPAEYAFCPGFWLSATVGVAIP